MHVEPRDPSDLDELRRLVARERDAKQRDRYRAVLLCLAGIDGVEATRVQIASALGRPRQFVDEWAKRYRRGGLAALVPVKPPGRPPRLTPADRTRLRERVLAGPTDADGGVCTLRGKDAKRILADEVGKPVSLSRAYQLLHELGLTPRRPRPRHHKADPAAAAAWQENAPLFSPPSGHGSAKARGSASGSRSGSRTRPASGNKGR